MNKLECDIIKDLLPLYVDGVASEASKEAVEKHIAECELCFSELESLKSFSTPKISDDNSKTELENIRKKINKNKKKSVIKAVAITLIIVMIIGWFSFKGVLISYSKKSYEALNINKNVTALTVRNNKSGTENAL